MKSKKLLACLLAGAMVLSMAACGGEGQESNGTDVQTQQQTETTPATTPEPVVEEVSIDFEDGNMSFVSLYTKAANADASELAVVDYNGGKALQVKNVNGKVPYVAFDIANLLGSNIANVASVEMTIATEYSTGKFSASEGSILSWTGADQKECKDGWSVYLASKNPNKAIAKVGEGENFVADAGNLIMVTMDKDNGVEEGNGNATMYIDNIRFLDASGNVMKADTSVAFVAPEGFEVTGRDLNLCYVENEVALEGFTAKADGWAQGGIDLTDEQRALIKPGTVLTVQYKSDAPVWFVAIGENPLGGWLRAVDQSTFKSHGFVASDNSTVQYTYEQLAQYWGEGFEQYLTTLQCESSAAWEVYSVTVGKKSTYEPMSSNATVLEGFTAKADGWAQGGIDLTDEQRALIKPGCVLEVAYKSDAPVWFVAIGENPLGGWLRAVDQSTFITHGGVNAEDGKVQYTYEQLAQYWGDGFEQYLTTLQCESSAAWEVYSVTVGTTFKPMANTVALEGFTAKADGWAQGGIDLTDEQRALIKPGCVLTVDYKSDAPVWFVAIGENPLGGWLRAVDQSTFITHGAVNSDAGKVQYTYEQLAQYWGEGFEQYLTTLQCESSAAWEVYGVTVGQTAQ